MTKKKKSTTRRKGARIESFEPLYLLEDEPVRDLDLDHLGLRPFAEVVAGAAVGTPGPFTVGVFADWGEGKTSVLRLAKRLLDEEKDDKLDHVVTVWFNAWQFEREDHPIVPLVASIVAAVERRREEAKNLSDRARESFGKLSRALRAIAYGFSAKTKVQVPGFAEVEAGFVAKEMVERYEKLQPTSDPLLDRSLYYSAFELLAEVAEPLSDDPDGEPPKIIVFIDDLDRCLPPQGLKLLEGLKLVLSQPGFVFALAVDRRVLESFLRRRYEEDFGMEGYEEGGRYYLDKLVQLPLALPAHRGGFERYVDRLLKDAPAFQNDRNSEVRSALNELAPVLAAGADFNPRSLVRFINNLIVDRNLWAAVQGEEPEAELLGLSIVARILRQHLGEQIYRRLVHADDICDTLAAELSSFSKLSKELENKHFGLPTRVSAILQSKPFLRSLIESVPGQGWLQHHDSRRRVHEFLAEDRFILATGYEDLSDQEIVEHAIREAIGKPFGPLTDENLAQVTRLTLVNIGDEGILELTKIPSLEQLSLVSDQLTDNGLAYLTQISSLVHLTLSSPVVTAAGLKALAKHPSLESLHLVWVKIMDEHLPYLMSLTSLKKLVLEDFGTLELSQADVAELRAALPNCRIEVTGYLDGRWIAV